MAYVCNPVAPFITFPADGHTFYTNEFTPAVFQCTSTGIPAPEISWYRNGTVLNSSTDARVTLSESSSAMLDCGVNNVTQTLTLNDTMDNDSGVYTCTSMNEVGKVATVDFILFVRGEIH